MHRYYKMLVFNSKRGVSPLIATILLIAFAVALGAVVMQLGTSLAAGECSADLQLSLESKPCFDGSQAKVKLKNSGDSDLSGVSVWIYGTKDGIKTKNLDEAVPPNAVFDIAIDYDKNVYGDIKSVDIIPKIKKDNAFVQCDSAKIESSNIASC